jgi:hypothetical protein
MATISNVTGLFRDNGTTLDLTWDQSAPGIIDIKIDDILWNPDGYTNGGVPHTGNFNVGHHSATVYGLSVSDGHSACVIGDNRLCTNTKQGKEWVIEFGNPIPTSAYYLIALMDTITGKTSYIEGNKLVVVM